MDKLYVKDMSELADKVCDAYTEVIKDEDSTEDVDVVADYYDTCELICRLVERGCGITHITELADPEYDGYDDAFVVSIYENDIWCEPVKRDSGYILLDSDVCFLMDNCNSKIIPHINSEKVYEVCVGEEPKELDFIDSDEKYTVNGKPVSKREYEEALADIDKKFQKHMEAVLKDYGDFITEMSNWRSIFK